MDVTLPEIWMVCILILCTGLCSSVWLKDGIRHHIQRGGPSLDQAKAHWRVWVEVAALNGDIMLSKMLSDTH